MNPSTTQAPSTARTNSSPLSAPSPRVRILLLLGFVLLLVPIITDTVRFHGDERFYTDAALQMTESGDYWTPRYPDGRIRLLKPVLTYWASAVPFKVFGVSLFSARILFLLAGAGVVTLTYLLGKTMFRSDRVALLAALLMASNIQLLTVATRATPDVLLCLSVLTSMLGCARIWLHNDRSFAASLLVFGGMGLAVQTKGLLGLCPIAANLLFLLIARPALNPGRRWQHLPAILIGLAIALFWYVVMLDRHGWGSMRDFYSDQVGSRLTRSVGFILGNFGVYLVAGIRHFLPWTIVLISAVFWGRTTLRTFWQNHRTKCLFLGSLFVLLVVIFGLGNIRRSRYLIASYPLLAVLMGAMISELAADGRLDRWLARGIRYAGALVAVAGLAFMIVGLPVHWRLGLAGALFTGLGVVGWVISRRKETARWIWISAAAIVGVVTFGSCIRPVFSPTPLVQVARELPETLAPNETAFVWSVSATDTARLRLLTHGAFPIQALGTNQGFPITGTARTVITTSKGHEALAQSGYSVRPIANSNLLGDSWLGRIGASTAEKTRLHEVSSFWLGVKNEN